MAAAAATTTAVTSSFQGWPTSGLFPIRLSSNIVVGKIIANLEIIMHYTYEFGLFMEF